MVAHHQLEPFIRMFILAGLTVVGFMAFGLALSFYRNTLFEQTLKAMQERNQQIKMSISEGRKSLDYYRSTQYKNKFAKENLDLVNQGEKVLIITEAPHALLGGLGNDPIIEGQKEVTYYERLRQMPIIEHWILYFFYPDKIDELKSSV